MSEFAKPTVQIDLTDPSLPSRVRDEVARVQALGPVVWNEALDGYWMVTDYDDVVRVSQEWETFTVTDGIFIPPTGASMPVVPLELDPPEHGKYRKLLLNDLSPKAVAGYEPRFRAVINSVFAEAVGRERIDLAEEIFSPIPIRALFTVLGIESEWQGLKMLGTQFLESGSDRGTARRAALAIEAFVQDEIDQRRGRPVVDLLGQIVNSTIDGEPIDSGYLLGLVQLLVLAGHETTVSAMGSTVYRYLVEPGARERLRADRSLIDNFINETLRMDPPAWHFVRTLTTDTELGGVPMQAHERVSMIYAAANRDPAKFDCPHKFDLDRLNAARHLSFGVGRHRCVGEAFAKLELRLVLERIIDLFPDIRLDGDPVWAGGVNTQGIRHLPVRL